MIKVPKTLTLNEVESLYALIKNPTSQELAIPTDLHCSQLGGVGGLIQLLVTWSKRHLNGCLLIHTTRDDLIGSYLRNLAHSHHGLIAMLLSADIRTANRQQSILPEGFGIYDQVLKKMVGGEYDQRSGPEILLICADDTEHAFIPQFYELGAGIRDQVKGQREFIDLADGLILNLSKRYKRSYHLDDRLRENLGTTLYELFKNTHQWARHEVDGEEVSRSVRGIRFELTRLAQLNLGRQPLRTQAYVKAAEEKRGNVDFLEITLFDSGPGLVARGLGHRVDEATSLDSEYAAVVKCLGKYSTSSGKDHRGIGLLEVMRTLTNADASLRIRTGRLGLFRNFVTDPLRDDGDLWLFDWFTESDRITEGHTVEGLLLSILIPIDLGGKR